MNEATWAAVGLAAITMVTNTTAAILSYLKERTTAKDRVRLTILEAEQAACKERDIQCQATQVRHEAQLAALHALVLGKRDI